MFSCGLKIAPRISKRHMTMMMNRMIYLIFEWRGAFALLQPVSDQQIHFGLFSSPWYDVKLHPVVESRHGRMRLTLCHNYLQGTLGQGVVHVSFPDWGHIVGRKRAGTSDQERCKAGKLAERSRNPTGVE